MDLWQVKRYATVASFIKIEQLIGDMRIIQVGIRRNGFSIFPRWSGEGGHAVIVGQAIFMQKAIDDKTAVAAKILSILIE